MAVVAFAADDGRMRFDGAAYPKPHRDESEVFFSSGLIPHFKIALEKSQYEALLKEPRKYARATVTVGDQVYPDVAIHLKGSASFRVLTDKPALTLNFDKFHKNQRFHGMDKLHLNNSVQDGTYFHEYVASLVCLGAGVPVGRVTHATVEVNGRHLGLYVLIEGFDRAFLRRHFSNWYGTLYQGAYVADIDGSVRKVSNDPRPDAADVKALVAAAKEPDPVKRRQRVGELLDVERFWSLMAAESMISHWDGYCQNRNNYSMYHDPTTDKFVFFAHGMDQILGDPNFTLTPNAAMLARIVTESPQDRRRYLEHYQRLYKTAFNVERLTNAVMQAAARLKPVLEQLGPNVARDNENAARDVCRRIVARAVGIERQLNAQLGLPWEPKPLKGWQSRVTEGQPLFDEVKEGEKTRFRIRTGDKPVTGSWRVRIVVPAGQYFFEGRIRTVDVPPANDPSQGAALRISGGQRKNSVTGSTDWQNVQYEFSAGEGVTDIELVCELRAAKGEAWFDADSLRVVRKEGGK